MVYIFLMKDRSVAARRKLLSIYFFFFSFVFFFAVQFCQVFSTAALELCLPGGAVTTALHCCRFPCAASHASYPHTKKGQDKLPLTYPKCPLLLRCGILLPPKVLEVPEIP